ncbi:MAG: heavy-metal-associated domain-containing protein [Gemmatimonadetes bacterium]|nr:heavy-metal-associated domain-containing protein [Gemmatimonadota bacterium]
MIAAVALALLAPVAWAQEPRPAQTAKQVEAAPSEVVLTVDGLACPLCAYGLKKKLGALDGVDEVEVALEKGHVHLNLKPGSVVTDATLRKTVKDAGFAIRRIERRGAAPSARK